MTLKAHPSVTLGKMIEYIGNFTLPGNPIQFLSSYNVDPFGSLTLNWGHGSSWNHMMRFFWRAVYTISIITLIPGVTYEQQEDKEEPPKATVQGKIESFKPTVSASHRENKDLISPWNWELPNMAIPRHSASCLTIGNTQCNMSHNSPCGTSKVQELNMGTEASFLFFISNIFSSVKSKNIAFRILFVQFYDNSS